MPRVREVGKGRVCHKHAYAWMIDFGCLMFNFAPRLRPRPGRGRDTVRVEFGNLALLRSVSVNLAELRRAPGTGGLVALLRSEPRELGRSYEGSLNS